MSLIKETSFHVAVGSVMGTRTVDRVAGAAGQGESANISQGAGARASRAARVLPPVRTAELHRHDTIAA